MQRITEDVVGTVGNVRSESITRVLATVPEWQFLRDQ